MRICDIDNQIYLAISATEAEKVKVAMFAGEIIDCGEALEWDDCLDLDGDLCLDEEPFDSVRAIILRLRVEDAETR